MLHDTDNITYLFEHAQGSVSEAHKAGSRAGQYVLASSSRSSCHFVTTEVTEAGVVRGERDDVWEELLQVLGLLPDTAQRARARHRGRGHASLGPALPSLGPQLLLH